MIVYLILLIVPILPICYILLKTRGMKNAEKLFGIQTTLLGTITNAIRNHFLSILVSICGGYILMD